MKEDNLILNKSFEFALMIIKLYQQLRREKEYVISKQLLRSGTSIGANVEEAIAAQSTKDFVSKMSIASKEARESGYWLRLLEKSQMVTNDYSAYIKEINEIMNILTAIVKTTQINHLKSKIYNSKSLK